MTVIVIVIGVIVALVIFVIIAIAKGTKKRNAAWQAFAVKNKLKYSAKGDEELENWLAEAKLVNSSGPCRHKTQNVLFGTINDVPIIVCLHSVFFNNKADEQNNIYCETWIILQTDNLPQEYDKTLTEYGSFEAHVRGNRLVIFRRGTIFEADHFDKMIEMSFKILKEVQSQ